MSLRAHLAAMSAPWTTALGEPKKVYTDLLVLAPESTSRSEQPSVSRMEEAMAWIIVSFWPSEKLGTHSTTFVIA